MNAQYTDRAIGAERPSHFSTDPTVEDRRNVREAPGPHFERAAKIWSAILGFNVRPDQVVQCQIGLKLAREAGMPDPDNAVDIRGYASLIPEVRDHMAAGPTGPNPIKEYADDKFR